MSNRVVIRNGKPGFIINGTFVPIPDSDNVNTTSPRIPRDDMSGLEAIGSVIKNTVTGKGAAGIRQDATKPNPNYGGRPKVTQDPDEYFGTGDYGSGGPKEKPKQRSADIRGGDDKVDGYGNPKIDYTKPQTQSIQVVPFPNNTSNTDTSTSDTSTSDTTSTPIPKSDPNVAVSPRTGEKTKFERRMPTTAELRAAQAARKTALDSGASKGEAEYQAVKAGVGVAQGTVKDPKIAADANRKAELERIRQRAASQTRAGVRPTVASTADSKSRTAAVTSSANPTTAVTGGVNPRAGTYAAELKRTTDALSSNFGALPKGTIKPAAERMKKEAYDVVLDYLLSEGHVDTVEEAHYVMLQMTSEHVQQVVEERTAADPKMKARMGYSNPAINGKPVLNPKGHPDAGKPMSFNKAETDGVNEYRRASKKAGRKIYADEPLPKK